MTLPVFGPSYNAVEALEILQIAAAADTFVPLNTPTGQSSLLDPTLSASGAPFDQSTEQDIPSIFYQRWPGDWQAAGGGQWGNWIVDTRLGNQALLAGLASQTEIPTYCLAFRGTMDFLNAIEDFAALPVTALPILDGLQTVIPAAIWNLLSADVQALLNTITLPKSYVDPANTVLAQNAKVHLGFRLALEAMDYLLAELPIEDTTFGKLIVPIDRNSLSGRIRSILLNLGGGKTEINLYVTGHSLGAGMAALAAAWLATQPFPGYTINVKCYSFAQPKPGNDYFSYATNILFQQKNFGFYTLLNSLDTVPQVPLTIQTSGDLNYWQGIEAIATAAEQSSPTAQAIIGKVFDVIASLNLPYNLNYMHAGTPIILNGTPVTTASPETAADIYTFPMNGAETVGYPAYLVNQGSGNGFVPIGQWTNGVTQSAITMNSTASVLWQHMPWTYEQLIVLSPAYQLLAGEAAAS
ncbi:lipase family protein [Azospirillum lipoferum]|uniref:Fungal lipase-type domain-containing protein n=1 Tax=Azospirillum lipoferum (strain 4B) TaxID=862719 RepID=G7Z9Q2_AZOL4|nr:hypothetical protein [Azospirillum lipoferum]CBS87685.1 protein of unknown function; putative lipase domain [Azospirillum lipoferum 4B]